jgi:hypothetical protein
MRVGDVALNKLTFQHVLIRVALNGVGPDVAPLDDVGPDVAPLDERDRGKELTAFEDLEPGATVEPGAAGRAVNLTAEKSR